MPEDPTPVPPPDILIGATFCLMSHYAQDPTPKLAEAVSEHLEMLARHPDAMSQELVRASARLSEHWLRLAKTKRAIQPSSMGHWPFPGAIQ